MGAAKWYEKYEILRCISYFYERDSYIFDVKNWLLNVCVRNEINISTGPYLTYF